MSEKPKLVTGWSSRIIRKRVQWMVLTKAFRYFHNPFHAFSALKKVRTLQNDIQGSTKITKYVRSGNQYYWNSDFSGFPSVNLKHLINSEFQRIKPATANASLNAPPLQTIIWGITNRCPLSCSHCYEWENISQSDHLDLNALKHILEIFRKNGLTHIQFSGGEPLSRFSDLLELIREAAPTMDCWLLTSGFGLTPDKAEILKDNGLKGVNISLDHWDDEFHNRFRNNAKSFDHAIDALRNCVDAGIISSLSLCATREFVTEENLLNYVLLAKQHGAHFIRILEPRAIGKFSGQKVQLEDHQVKLLSEFTIRMNTLPEYSDFPIIAFIGDYQRRIGCFGAGVRYVYADPNGNVHACPFCRGVMGNLLQEPFDEILAKLKKTGCHLFK